MKSSLGATTAYLERLLIPGPDHILEYLDRMLPSNAFLPFSYVLALFQFAYSGLFRTYDAFGFVGLRLSLFFPFKLFRSAPVSFLAVNHSRHIIQGAAHRLLTCPWEAT